MRAAGKALNVYERKSFYVPTITGKDGRRGYVDYPDLDGTVGEAGKYKLMEQERIGSSLGSASK